MGRRKSGVWRHFSEIEVDGITRAKCDACAQDLVSNPDRMQKHIDKCEAFKENNGPETSVPPQKKQTTLPISTFSTSKTQQHQLDLHITRYIIASNTSFLQVENKYFQELVSKLRPGTKVPSRKMVAGPLLDEVFAEEKQCCQKIKSCFVARNLACQLIGS